MLIIEGLLALGLLLGPSTTSAESADATPAVENADPDWMRRYGVVPGEVGPDEAG
jgi:hypothetical protein